MRTTITTIAAVLGAISTAHAADLAPVLYVPAPVYDWSGIYIGGVVGGRFVSTTLGNGSSDFEGFGGVEGSTRFQFGRLVLGGDVDYTLGSDIVKQMATLTGVVGAAQDNWLLYAKGGAAWATPEYTVQGFYTTCVPIVCTNHPIDGTVSDPRVGYTLGAGIEWTFLPNLSVRAEYDFTDLLSGTANTGIQNPAFVTETTLIHRAQISLRWHVMPNFR